MTEQPARPRPAAKPAEHVSSMCLLIAGFYHDDCPGLPCRCDCHNGEAVSS